MIPGIPRSQIRHNVRLALEQIHPNNSPTIDPTKKYGSHVQRVESRRGVSNTTKPSDMPWVGMRIAEHTSENFPSGVLVGDLQVELTLRVRGINEAAADDALDMLIDDVIAAMYSNYANDGATYQAALIAVRDQETEEPFESEAVLIFGFKYQRGYGICRTQ